MKRLITLAAAFAAIFFASSCEKCDCPDPSQYATQWNVYNYDLTASDWELCEIGAEVFYRAALEVPKLDANIYKDGLVQVNIYAGSTLAPLPYETYHKVAEGDGYVMYQEKYDYEYEAGKVYIYYTASDFVYGGGPTASFKVTLVY